MKYGMKLSNYDIAMIGNLSALTEDKMKGILVDKGDIDPIKRVPLVGFLLEDFDDSFADKGYFRGEKADKKYISIKEEVSMMEKENWEKARSAMMDEHSMILSSVMEDIDTLNMDLKSSVYSIENLKLEYKELEEAMKLVSEKLQNAKLRRKLPSP